METNDSQTTLAEELPAGNADTGNTTGTELPTPSLRESLAAGLETLTDAKTAEKPRDEVGKFVPKTEAAPTPGPTRPTTWKKEYLATWDKIQTGQPTTPEEMKALLEYTGNQRETEYKTGVSTYRAEAEQAKHLQAAIEPFMADLQKHNIPPAQFISNLGNAHRVLALGTPEQKIGLFRKLATDYGVPIESLGQADNSVVSTLMSQIDQLKAQIGEVTSWRAGSEQKEIHGTIESFKSAKDDTGNPKYPHFETLRETMSQILGNGMAGSLEEAYEKATWLNPEIRTLVSSQGQPTGAEKAAAAKKRAVSLKSSAPTGTAARSTGTTDRRAALEEHFEAATTGRI